MMTTNPVQAINPEVTRTQDDVARSDEEKRIREEDLREAETKKASMDSEERGRNVDETA